MSAPSLATLFAPLREAAPRGRGFTLDAVGTWTATGGERHEIVRCRFVGPSVGGAPIRLGLFAGVHGDEPAGCVALVQFLHGVLEQPERATGYELMVYPVVNPAGYVARTRANASGKDLNREFWRGSVEREVQIIEHELRTHAFAGVITLHADDTCEGHYGYSHGQALDDALLQPALQAAEKIMPRDRRAVIDGFHAREGVISDCFQGVLSAPPEQTPRPFNLIFETPAQVPLELQVAANVAALDAILATYRGMIAYAQGI